MIFFTRELYLGYQPGAERAEQARIEWRRRLKIYRRYWGIVASMVPANVRRLHDAGLHDSVVEDCRLTGRELTMIVDTSAWSDFGGSTVSLRFGGVRGRPRVAKVAGRDWLYEEVHLSAHARFSFHILLEGWDLEIQADDLDIEVL